MQAYRTKSQQEPAEHITDIEARQGVNVGLIYVLLASLALALVAGLALTYFSVI